MAANAEHAPNSEYSCQNCISWCEKSYQQYGNRSAFGSCVAGCSQQNTSCTAPAPKANIEYELPPSVGDVAPTQSEAPAPDNSPKRNCPAFASGCEVQTVPPEIQELLSQREGAVLERERYAAQVSDLKFQYMQDLTSSVDKNGARVTFDQLNAATDRMFQQEAGIAQIDRKLAEKGIAVSQIRR